MTTVYDQKGDVGFVNVGTVCDGGCSGAGRGAAQGERHPCCRPGMINVSLRVALS